MGRRSGLVMNLENYITAKQQQEICGIIQTQCRRFQEMEREYRTLFYEPYIATRQKHSVTAAVLPNEKGVQVQQFPLHAKPKLEVVSA